MASETTEQVYRQQGMRKLTQLMEFIKNKPDHVSVVRIESKSFRLDIPIDDKDVMCMKVIELIKDEYGDHTTKEALDMLQDTIWWLQTCLIAFPDSGISEQEHTPISK